MATVEMPQMGTSVVEGTLAEWLVAVGQEVAKDQTLCRIATDKINNDLPSPVAGVVARILVAEGQTVPVGTPLLEIKSQVMSEESRDSGLGGRRSPSEPSPLAELTDSKSGAEAQSEAIPGENSAPHASSPVVRKLSQESGVAISSVAGTGLSGRVTKRDMTAQIERASRRVRAVDEDSPAQRDGKEAPRLPDPPRREGVSSPHEASYSPFGGLYKVPAYTPKAGDRIVPFSRRRRIIAEHMVFSKQVAPHVTAVAEVDMTRVIQLKKSLGSKFAADEGLKLTVLPFVIDATVRAIKDFPEINATVQMEHLVIRREINMGVAVETNDGLVVPVIRGAHNMNLAGLARVLADLTQKARDGRLDPQDLADGSFTISNPGKEGNLFGMPIINQPQIAVLRMGEVVKRPMVLEIDGEDVIAVRHMMYLALAYDHRVVDGVLGNRFLHRVKTHLQDAFFSGL